MRPRNPLSSKTTADRFRHQEKSPAIAGPFSLSVGVVYLRDHWRRLKIETGMEPSGRGGRRQVS
jgi:hypothetical protein